MRSQYKTWIMMGVVAGLASACGAEVDDDFDGVDDDRAIACGNGGIVAPTTSIDCPRSDVIEQYVYLEGLGNNTVRLKRMACSDVQKVTPWSLHYDAPGGANTTVLGAASVYRGSDMLDYVLGGNGNIYHRTRDPFTGSKSSWQSVGNNADFPAQGQAPTTLALYDDADGRTVMSVSFAGYSMFRGIPSGTPHDAPGGFSGRNVPVKALESMTGPDWGRAFAGELWVRVLPTEVPGAGQQIAHTTY
nr:hypothetical protein [Deltaproteobacteria bacterium]